MPRRGVSSTTISRTHLFIHTVEVQHESFAEEFYLAVGLFGSFGVFKGSKFCA